MSTSADSSRAPGKRRTSIFRSLVWQTIFLVGFACIATWIDGRARPTLRLEPPREIALDEITATFTQEKILWIDARSAAAFAEKHFPGAVPLSEENWEEGLPKFVEAWTPGQPIVVYCSTTQCGSSRAVAWRLVREFNANRVHYLKGGWDVLKSRTP